MPIKSVNKKVGRIKEVKTSDKSLSGIIKLTKGERRCDLFSCRRSLPKNTEAWYYLDNYYCSALCLIEAVKGQ